MIGKEIEVFIGIAGEEPEEFVGRCSMSSVKIWHDDDMSLGRGIRNGVPMYSVDISMRHCSFARIEIHRSLVNPELQDKKLADHIIELAVKKKPKLAMQIARGAFESGRAKGHDERAKIIAEAIGLEKHFVNTRVPRETRKAG